MEFSRLSSHHDDGQEKSYADKSGPPLDLHRAGDEARDRRPPKLYMSQRSFALYISTGALGIMFCLLWITGILCVRLPSLDDTLSDASSRWKAPRLQSRYSAQEPITTVEPPSFQLESWSNTTLVPFAFRPLPLGSIKPQGWLLDQMTLMAAGLAGHEYDFYPIVQSNPWLGGTSEYSPLNEGFPYWFNGLVPLAYGLDDPRLKSQVLNATNYVLAHQDAAGWLGPEKNYDSNSLWGRFPFFLGLMQLVQADSSFNSEAIPAMHKFVNLMNTLLVDGKSTNEIWGRVRYADMILTLQWLYETHPDGNEKILLQTMQRLETWGRNWTDYYTPQNYLFADLDTIPVSITDADFPFVHAVNVGQGLKTGGVNYRFTRDATQVQSVHNAVNWTFAYHGAPSGTILGDERESGLAPNRGSELCTAVETMFSMSYLYHVLGENSFADQSELIAFNALPVMMTPDHWAHQYIALPNQPFAGQVQSGGLFWNVGDYGMLYGLAPNYPCCAVNHPQGYPKFLAASFVQVGTNGLGHALLSPGNVSTTLSSGASVSVDCETNYPFGNSFVYTIRSTKSFWFYIRLPTWNSDGSSTMSINNGSSHAPEAEPRTGMTSVRVSEGTTTIQLTLAPSLRVVPRANSTISVYYGSLLYALDVGEAVSTLNAAYVTMQRPPAQSYGRTFPSIGPQSHVLATSSGAIPPQVHNVVYNSTLPWNFAIDPTTFVYHDPNNSAKSTTGLPNPIWDYQAPSTFVTARGCQIDWVDDHGGVPQRVPLPGNRTCISAVQDVVFRPYGSLKVHMAELPVMNLTGI